LTATAAIAATLLAGGLPGTAPVPANGAPATVTVTIPVPVDMATPTVSEPPSADPVEPAPAPSPEEILVTGRQSIPGDPLNEINAVSFDVVQAADRAVVRPAAMAYRAIVPLQGRHGVRNFLSNLAEPVVFINFLLQAKLGKAAETAGRFAINSTVGAAGLIDIAKRKPFNLPKRSNGFANTLGFYGVKPGAFLFLPIVGPTTLRDLVGLGLDRLMVPLAVGKPLNQSYYTIPSGVLTSLDQRAESDEQLAKLNDETGNAYVATRRSYLQRRQAEIDLLRGMKRDGQNPLTVPR
jgi:phospholipid-binding lipoprotein MlaA